MGLVQLAEYGQQLIGYQLVTNHLAHMGASFQIYMRNPQVAQVATLDVRIIVPGFALHGLPYAIGNSCRGKNLALRT